MPDFVIEHMAPADLRPHPQNFRRHPAPLNQVLEVLGGNESSVGHCVVIGAEGNEVLQTISSTLTARDDVMDFYQDVELTHGAATSISPKRQSLRLAEALRKQFSHPLVSARLRTEVVPTDSAWLPQHLGATPVAFHFLVTWWPSTQFASESFRSTLNGAQRLIGSPHRAKTLSTDAAETLGDSEPATLIVSIDEAPGSPAAVAGSQRAATSALTEMLFHCGSS